MVDPARDVELKNAKRWLTGRPESRNAWLIGEALRHRDENLQALIKWSSGLLALYWFGHLDDFIGVLACCEMGELMKFEPRFMAMLRAMRATSLSSPYDALPFNHSIFTQDADEFSLRLIADTKIVQIPVDLSFEKEARILNDRRMASSIWELPDDLYTTIRDGAKRWFNETNHESMIERADSRPLKLAYSISRSNIDDDDALDLAIDLLTQWFYTKVMPQPMPENIDLLYGLANDPDSATSRAILTGFRSYGLITED